MTLENWLKDHWYHLDGTPCPENMAPSFLTAGGQHWWCHDHQQNIVYVPPVEEETKV